MCFLQKAPYTWKVNISDKHEVCLRQQQQTILYTTEIVALYCTVLSKTGIVCKLQPVAASQDHNHECSDPVHPKLKSRGVPKVNSSHLNTGHDSNRGA